MNRRDFLRLGVGAAVGGLGWVAYDLARERYALRVVRWRLAIPHLPPTLAGLRIAHLSDLHAGPCTPWWLVERAVALAQAEAPDLVFLTGDYVSLPWHQARRPLEKTLAGLRARLGVFAVLGNHDWVFKRHRPVVEALRGAGATVLANEARAVQVGSAELWIAGVDDPVTARDNLPQALDSVPREAPVLLLAHTPDIIVAAADAAVAAVFAGHTHGGQVNLPLLGPPVVPSKYGRRFAAGRFRVGNTVMYVTRGVGMVPPLIRFRCPPEVALLTLTPAA
jgi:predicted MPP superfamily phosphohydrolase